MSFSTGIAFNAEIHSTVIIITDNYREGLGPHVQISDPQGVSLLKSTTLSSPKQLLE